MTDKRILFGKFEIPRLHGLKYLLNEEKLATDFLFVNEPHGRFSIYFEEGFPRFRIPDQAEREYRLYEQRRQNRRISFFCPERPKNPGSVIWYFYIELLDSQGVTHELPGQIRIRSRHVHFPPTESPGFIDVLEQIKLTEDTGIA